jgi:hypothetical protein
VMLLHGDDLEPAARGQCTESVALSRCRALVRMMRRMAHHRPSLCVSGVRKQCAQA